MPAGPFTGHMLRATRAVSGQPVRRSARLNNQVSNYDRPQRWTPEDLDGQRCAGQTCHSPGSRRGELAWEQEAHATRSSVHAEPCRAAEKCSNRAPHGSRGGNWTRGVASGRVRRPRRARPVHSDRCAGRAFYSAGCGLAAEFQHPDLWQRCREHGPRVVRPGAIFCPRARGSRADHGGHEKVALAAVAQKWSSPERLVFIP